MDAHNNHIFPQREHRFNTHKHDFHRFYNEIHTVQYCRYVTRISFRFSVFYNLFKNQYSYQVNAM